MNNSKAVILKNWGLKEGEEASRFIPKHNTNILYKPIDAKNKECYAVVKGWNTESYKDDINNQLSVLSKNILSDRVRTLNKVPKKRSITTTKYRF